MKSNFIALLLLGLLLGTALAQVRTVLERSYIILNSDGTKDSSNNQVLTTSQYIAIPNFDFARFTQGFTLEAWVLWRGPVTCNNFFRNTGVCPKIDNAPIFLFFQDANNYLYLTPAVNQTLISPSPTTIVANDGFGSLKLASGGTVRSVTLVDNLITPEPEGITAFQWVHVAVSYNPTSGNAQVTLGRQTTDTSDVRNFATSWNATFSMPGFSPAALGSGTFYLGGFDSTVTPPAGTAANYIIANFAEFRVWNVTRTPAEILSTRYVSLVGNERNLVNYFRLDETTGTVVTDSVTNLGASLSKGVSDPAIEHRLNTQPEEIVDPFSAGIINQDRFFSAWRKNAELPHNSPAVSFSAGPTSTGAGTVTFTYTSVSTGSIRVGQEGSLAAPTGSSFTVSCPTSGVRCYGILEFTPNRDSCGKSFSFTMVATDIGNPASTATNISVAVRSAPAPVVSNNGYTAPTSGGVISLAGTFGVDGTLATGEYFRVVIGSNTFTCNNQVVSGAVSCTIGSGVGTGGSVQVSSCGSTATFPNFFSYQPPTITSVSGTNDTNLLITGTNFGNLVASASVLIDGNRVNCIITSITHTQIVCNQNAQLTSGSNYSVTVTVGGQAASTFFDYNICPEPCQNGGRCVGYATCDCRGTSFTGPICNQAIECNPKCKNGQCVLSGANPVCQCPSGFSGVDCGVRGSQTLAIALGVVGGLALIIVVLVILVIVFAKRKEKRYKGDLWVPLDKKDFTKIIYGEQLGESVEKGSGDLKSLDQLLLEDNMKLVSLICQHTQITEADKVAKALVIIFQDHGKVLALLEKFISEEVEATEHAGNLFRSNSMVSKMFKFYSRLIGLPYLYTTIGPEIIEMVAEEMGLEVDPEKMEDGADLDEMRWTLMAQSQKILKQILNSSEECPTEFRSLFVHIEKSVKTRYPDNVRTTIGGFIFLRFFCPAVSSPEAYGILDDPPSANARRLLILITKVLQNLSNDVEFGSKEPYMTKMNDFVHANRDKLSKFYDKLLKASTKDPIHVTLPKNMKNVSLAAISQHIRSIIDKIEDKDLRAKLDQIAAKD